MKTKLELPKKDGDWRRIDGELVDMSQQAETDAILAEPDPPANEEEDFSFDDDSEEI